MEPDPLLVGSKFEVWTGVERPRLEELYKKSRSCDWDEDEIKFTDDIRDIKRVSAKERHLLLMVLAFFAKSDSLVNYNLGNFFDEIKDLSAKSFYAQQMLIEMVHTRTYGNTLQALVEDREERDRLINADETVVSIGDKIRWGEKWADYPDKSPANFGLRVSAFAMVEGIFFCSSFAIVYWFKHRSLFAGVCQANEFISRDESMHADFACAILLELKPENRPSEIELHRMAREAVEAEKAFVRECLPSSLVDISADKMCQYIEYMMDERLSVMYHSGDRACEPIYNTEQPFEWMDLISLPTKANFFEHDSTNYQKNRGKKPEENAFTVDDSDF